MSELVKIVDSLESKINTLLIKLEALKKSNDDLENKLIATLNNEDSSQKLVSEWEEKYNSLKLANSMLGSNTNKTEAKLKINTLIRELDYCISQLAE